jgi:aromatic ring-cleaving dioxygenase
LDPGEVGLDPAGEGPHPVPQFRFMLKAAQFENIVTLNRQGLDVLVDR